MSPGMNLDLVTVVLTSALLYGMPDHPPPSTYMSKYDGLELEFSYLQVLLKLMFKTSPKLPSRRVDNLFCLFMKSWDIATIFLLFDDG